MTFYTDDCKDQARNFVDMVYETEHKKKEDLTMYQKDWEYKVGGFFLVYLIFVNMPLNFQTNINNDETSEAAVGN